jgi:lipopolysaccharide assembly outer membrane protein LptD (OstA)
LKPNNILLLFFLLFVGGMVGAQEADTVETNPISAEELSKADSTGSDSIVIPAAPVRKSPLEHEVEYQSEDSMRIDLNEQKVYLYGNAVAIYGDIELKADYIEITLKTSELYAKGLPDSTGAIAGEPIFKQGEKEFEAEEMRYNFKSQRGLSKHVKTQESGGYLHGELVKRDTGEVIYIKDGKYTTCEYDEPHFHIHAGKLKVIPQDKIITGPAYLTIADIPTPLVLPFGFLPNTEGRANGLIVPAWGEAVNQGFFLKEGGYYFGVKDVMDFSITADIYSRGSWATYARSNYVKRYRFRGNYGLEFVQSRFSEREYPDFFSQNTFNVKWNHQQDPKARPGSNFSAEVNAGSSKNYRNNIQANADNFLRSQLNSSIRYSKAFDNTPFNLAIAATGSQNTQTSFVNLRAPDISLNMARIFPFKPKSGVPSKLASAAGLDKLGINGSLDMANTLEGNEDTIFNNFNNRMLRNMDNGIRLNTNASTNLKLFKYITLTPSTTHRLVGYRQTVVKNWNPDSAEVNTRRVTGLDGFYDGSASLSLTSIIYGTYQYKSDVVKAMRHQITPTASISYRPDYSTAFWGYFGQVQSDTLGNFRDYSFFENGIYGGPSAQENGVVNLAINNMFELKVRNRKDSTSENQEKKLRIIDAFNFNTNYNIARDSLNWAPLTISVRSQVLRGLIIDGGATLDPYYTNPANNIRYNEWQFDRTGQLGTWTQARVAFSYNIQPKSSKPRSEENENTLRDANLYYTDFIDFDVPWNLRFNYNIQYRRIGQIDDITQVIDLQGDANLTQNWRVAIRTGFDIKNQDVTFSEINLYRNLHCWEFSLGVVPFGIRQSYNFQINVKSSVLKDLQLPRRRQFAVPDRG